MAPYTDRRNALLAKMPPNSLAVVFASPMRIRSRDTDFVYRQNSDFHYLTGFDEPEALLVLVRGARAQKSLLFCRAKDELRERWEGERLGPKSAPKRLGVDAAYPSSQISRRLPKLLMDKERLFMEIGEAAAEQQVLGFLGEIRMSREAHRAPKHVDLLGPLLHEMRAIKRGDEIELMREAARISSDAHHRAMRTAQPGMGEWQLEAEIVYEFMRRGARAPAYTSIVGSGANACVLHYVENSAVMQDGDLVLIDAGCEYKHYAADITRTFPVSGRFTEAQRNVYEIVLRAQLAAIDACKPGNLLDAPHQAAIREVIKGLVDLGLLEGDLDMLIKEDAHQPYFMHGTSHFLGLDVHDVGARKQAKDWRTLEPGMVLTVEPGIYMVKESVPEQYRGIGIRIEDDVLITESGHEVLTEDAVKTITDIEALMGGMSG
ncbi:MAG: Xaa-Pro aminopeptidase [Gammaproteobacteria bacterium]|nr:Xaa-Pro aminopeptidase [Gammaproteobacteria bacterium]